MAIYSGAETSQSHQAILWPVLDLVLADLLEAFPLLNLLWLEGGPLGSVVLDLLDAVEGDVDHLAVLGDDILTLPDVPRLDGLLEELDAKIRASRDQLADAVEEFELDEDDDDEFDIRTLEEDL